MNSNDEDIEVLDTPSTSSDVNRTSDTNVQQPSQLESDYGVENVSSTSAESEPSEIPSMVSPLMAKPSISGTTANSPRISPDDTMAKTVHSASQTTPPKNYKKEDKLKAPSDHDSNVESTNGSSKTVKPIVLIVTFIILLVAIIFLPMSGDLFDSLFSKDDNTSEEVTNGSLVCTLEHDDNGDGISLQYTETYDFSDSKVESLEHEVLIQGNADYLTERNTECELLQSEAADITSVQIDCDLSSNQMIETQYFNLSTLDFSLLDIGFTEAGGVYPNGMSGENYKDVQRSLEMSGYDCELK